MAYNADEEIRRLKQISAKKPIIKRGLPDTSEGRDGDVALCLNKSGLGLYVKFNNRWYKFGEGKQVITGGSAAVDLSMRTSSPDTEFVNLRVTGILKGKDTGTGYLQLEENSYLGTNKKLGMLKFDGSTSSIITDLVSFGGVAASAHMKFIVGSTSGYDAFYSIYRVGNQIWKAGNDETVGGSADTNTFKIETGTGTSFSDTSEFELDTNGNLTIKGDLQVNGNDIAFDAAASTIGVDASAEDTIGQQLTISAGSTTEGTSNDIAGGLLALKGGQGKGSGAGGGIRFQVADGGSSGSDYNDYAVALAIADDKKVTMNGDVTLDGGTLSVKGASGSSANVLLVADDEEDNADVWRVRAGDAVTSNVLTFSNKISGSQVTHLTISPHATVTSSNAIFAGNIAVNGTSGITAGAPVWKHWVFHVTGTDTARYYYMDISLNTSRYPLSRWSGYATSLGSDIITIYDQDIAGFFVVPEDCIFAGGYGLCYNDTGTDEPTIMLHSDGGGYSDADLSDNFSKLSEIQINGGAGITQDRTYNFVVPGVVGTTLDAGTILVPTIKGTSNTIWGSFTAKFMTK